VVGVCRLCGRETELAESHVLPKWMFKDMRDASDRHRMAELKIGEKAGIRITQDGPTQPLLCQSCDNSFSDIERYAERFLTQKVLPRVQEPISLQYRALGFRPVDYEKLKLFWILNLFRMSIAQLSYFREVRLDRSCEADLKTMLLDRDPGSESVFAVTALLPVDETAGLGKVFNKALSQIVLMPSVISWEGATIVRLVCAGLAWAIFVREAPKRRFISLREEGKFLVFPRNLRDIPFLSGTLTTGKSVFKRALTRL